MTATFTIVVGDSRTSVRVQADTGTDPRHALALAIGCLQAEMAELRKCPAHRAELIEAKALEIYDGWKHLTGWVPWVEGGNSTMQDTARRQASAHGVTRPEHQTDSQHTPMEDKHGSGDPKG